MTMQWIKDMSDSELIATKNERQSWIDGDENDGRLSTSSSAHLDMCGDDIESIDKELEKRKAAQATKPKGLYGKYSLKKADGREVDSDGEYFVLKLNSKDKVHGLASRRALLAYARTLQSFRHLPELQQDLLDCLERHDMDTSSTPL